MTFRKSSLCLLALIAVSAVPLDVGAQNNQAGVTHGVTQAVQEAKKAGVPDETINRLLSLGYDNGVEAASMANLVSIVVEVKNEDLPQEPFLNKIEEGVAKHVPAASIEQVLKQKKQDYLFARSLTSDYLKKHGLKQQVAPKDLVGITESLFSGLSREDLALIMEQAPPVSPTTLRRAIHIQASLKQVGFDPKLSDQIVSTGFKHNFFTHQQRGFGRAIVAGKRNGVSDAKIAEAAMSTMQSGGTVAGFCSQIGVSFSDVDRPRDDVPRPLFHGRK
ncbi:exported hypothetical protein [Syntrophobacter sp. SbD1]|nr:exported hypothetical protein [Syntrophobacter sp. SbD1]